MLRITLNSVKATKKLPTLKCSKTARQYSEICPPPKKKGSSSTGTIYTLGALALVGGATVGYAKYDPEFRKTLVNTAPFMDDVLKVLLMEESLGDKLEKAYKNTKSSVFDLIFGAEEKKHEKQGAIKTDDSYQAPAPIMPEVEKSMKSKEKFSEIREQTKEGEEKIGGVAKPQPKDLPETHPKNLIEIEDQLCTSTGEAVNAYNNAFLYLRRFNQEVEGIIEESVDNISPSVWDDLRAMSREKDKSLEIAKEKANISAKNIAKFKVLITQPDFKADEATKTALLGNLQKMQDDINEAKKKLDIEVKVGAIVNKYWDKVEKARRHFSEELESLFPSVDIKNKSLNIPSEDLDLFLTHVYSHVLFYQKELAKAETIAQDRLQAAVDAAKRGGGEALTTAQICEALEMERKKLAWCFQKQCLKIRQESEEHLREQLKRQSQAFSDHLQDAMRLKEQEVDRGLARKFDEELEEAKCRYKMQLAAMVGRLRGLDKAMKVRAEADRAAKQSQILWAACQALVRAIKSGCPGMAWHTQLRSLMPELTAIKKASAEGDELVNAVIQGIPEEAKDRGIYPEDALRERFLKVERIARFVSLVPEQGAALPVYILSYIQSLLLVKNPSPIPQAELDNEEVNFSALSTNDILQRARYWLDRGDFMQTLKYMNLLSGASRSVARQWMHETRILLETQQAANTLMAHAASSGLMYL